MQYKNLYQRNANIISTHAIDPEMSLGLSQGETGRTVKYKGGHGYKSHVSWILPFLHLSRLKTYTGKTLGSLHLCR